MRLQGKSYKEVREAFIELRASYQYSQKQLEIARASRDDNSKEISRLNRKISGLESRLSRVSENLSLKLKTLKDLHKKEIQELLKEISILTNKVEHSEVKLEETRKKVKLAHQAKYVRKVRSTRLHDKLRETSELLRKANAKIERLENRPKARPRIRIRKVRERVFVTKVVKEPIPDKIRQLMSNNTITQSKMDILLVASALLNFSDKTKLTLRQMVMLLEANSLNYFTNRQLLLQSPFTLKELEYKQLISGDRANTKRAIGWFITKKGKRVAEMLLKKVYENNLKRQYLNYEN